MTREEYVARQKRKREIQLRRRCILAASIFITAIILIISLVRLISGDTDDIEANNNQNQEQNANQDAESTNPDEAITKAYDGQNTTTGWVTDETGNRYFPDVQTYYADGWKDIDSQLYYFDEDGYILIGWHTLKGTQYFFDFSGKLQPYSEPKLIAFTYDDGPSTYTTYLLDYLEEYGAKATFFTLGERVGQYRDTIKRMQMLGMEIGSHTYAHDTLTQLTVDEIKETMDKTDEALAKVIGHGATLMRPVGGSYNETVAATVKQPIIMWSVDTRDWESRDAESIASIIMEKAKDGSIVLMHDLYKPTLEATQKVLPLLIEQGYIFVTISELAEARGLDLQAGVVYESFPKTPATPTATPELE